MSLPTRREWKIRTPLPGMPLEPVVEPEPVIEPVPEPVSPEPVKEPVG